MFSSAKLAVASVLVAATLSACVVEPVPGGGVVAYAAPPELRIETVGVAPAPGYFWVGGSWFWEGGRYAWHGGYWERPRPGYHWVAHSWQHSNGNWHERPGHWARYG